MPVASDWIWPVAGLLLFAAATLYLLLLALEQQRRQRWSARQAARELDLIDARLDELRQQQVDAGRDGGWNGFRKLVVARKQAETADVCSFYLQSCDGRRLPSFLPGQFLTFQLSVPGQARPVVRCYSLSDAPGLDHFRVSIKRLGAAPGQAPGLGSNHFHERVQEGDILDVRAPSGHFFLSDEETRPVVLLAGGIGITPMLSMLRTLQRRGDRREIWLFHGVRHPRDRVQAETLRTIARECGNVRVVFCFSQPDPDQALAPDEQPGVVSIERLKQLLPSNNYVFFLCGPGPFMAALTSGLEAWGVPETDVHFEAFGPSTVKRRSQAVAPEPSADAAVRTPCQVTLARSGTTLIWDDASDNLLDLVEAHGVEVDSGCRAGNCGTCLTAVRGGTVEYSSPPGSPPEPGSCLLCIARPAAGDLVLDL